MGTCRLCGFSRYLSQIDWLGLISYNLTVDSLWSSFCKILQTGIDLYVPTYHADPRLSSEVKAQNGKKYPKRIRQAMNRKMCLCRVHGRRPADSAVLEEYRSARRNCRQLINEYEAKREAAVVNSRSLQNLSHSLAQPPSVIFTSFMSTGHVPQAWKQATVTPVFKGGIASDPSNYRPISLISVFNI